jgi:hypothetical protein
MWTDFPWSNQPPTGWIAREQPLVGRISRWLAE